MKLIIILGIEDLQDKLFNVLKEVRLQVFSKVDILGHMVGEDADFSKWIDSKHDVMYSKAVFTFINDEEAAQGLLKQIGILNRSQAIDYPFHAYQLDVEKFIE